MPASIDFPFELTIERGGEYIEPSPEMHEPRPSWHLVDGQGHGHFYGGKSDPYPTLAWVSEPCSLGHGEDCTAEGHFECKICREEIQPGTQPAKAVWVDGPNSYRLTVVVGGQQITYAFGEEQWDQLKNAWREVAHETLGEFVVEVVQGP